MIGRARPLDERDPVVAPLVALAARMQALPLGPSDDFRDSLRARLLAAAAVAPAPEVFASPTDRVRTWVEGWRVQRGLAAAAAGMAAVVGIAGVSVASSRSLPGDPFYGVKRSTEDVQLAFARGDVARGTRHLQHAETRLDEVARMVGSDLAFGALPEGATLALGASTAERVAGALGEMDESTDKGSRLLTQAYERDRETAPLKTLASFAERQRTHLAGIVDELPPETRDEAAASLDLIAKVEMQANALLNNGACGEDCQPAAPAPTPVASRVPQPEPQPQPEPSESPTSTRAPSSPQPEPSPTRPAPQPTATGDPEPTPSATPSPTPSQSRLPVPGPEPIPSVVNEVVETVESLLPTPLPIPPAPEPTVLPFP